MTSCACSTKNSKEQNNVENNTDVDKFVGTLPHDSQQNWPKSSNLIPSDQETSPRNFWPLLLGEWNLAGSSSMEFIMISSDGCYNQKGNRRAKDGFLGSFSTIRTIHPSNLGLHFLLRPHPGKSHSPIDLILYW